MKLLKLIATVVVEGLGFIVLVAVLWSAIVLGSFLISGMGS